MKHLTVLGLAATLLLTGCGGGGSQVSDSSTAVPAPTATATPSPKPDCSTIGDRVLLYPKPQVNLQGCSFANRQFQRASDWGEANLRGADFSGAYLHYADFSFADLSNVNFSGAFIDGAKFTNANLRGANFDGAIWKCLADEGINGGDRIRWSEAINVPLRPIRCY
jgi:uncharacterized protein YjbI with pentapeptide repeats